MHLGNDMVGHLHQPSLACIYFHCAVQMMNMCVFPKQSICSLQCSRL